MVFVEGDIDKDLVSAFARRLKIDLKGIEIIPLDGKDKAKYHLKAWTEDIGKMLPFFVIFDSDAKNNVKELVKQEILRDNYHIWKEGSIENYYPISAVQKVLEKISSEYDLSLNICEILKKIRKRELSPQNIALGKKSNCIKKKWKRLLADEMVKLIFVEKFLKIKPEVEEVLIRISKM